MKGDPGIRLLFSQGGGDDGGVRRECGDLWERQRDREMKSGRRHDN